MAIVAAVADTSRTPVFGTSAGQAELEAA